MAAVEVDLPAKNEKDNEEEEEEEEEEMRHDEEADVPLIPGKSGAAQVFQTCSSASFFCQIA